MTLLPPTHLTDSSNSGHDGVLKELKLLTRLAEEEVDLIIITYRAAQALGNIGRGHEGRVCRGQGKIQLVQEPQGQHSLPRVRKLLRGPRQNSTL